MLVCIIQFMVLKKFIVLEGIDGAGTSTQIKRLVQTNPDKYIATAEPTSGPTGKFLRQMLAGDFKVDERNNPIFLLPTAANTFLERAV